MENILYATAGYILAKTSASGVKLRYEAEHYSGSRLKRKYKQATKSKLDAHVCPN